MIKIVKNSRNRQKAFTTKEQFVKELDSLEDKINSPLNSVLNLDWEQIEEIKEEINRLNHIIFNFKG
ncbi:MAG: hypothetical protein ACRCTZ_16045 [Sarcina sp.]